MYYYDNDNINLVFLSPETGTSTKWLSMFEQPLFKDNLELTRSKNIENVML